MRKQALLIAGIVAVVVFAALALFSTRLPDQSAIVSQQTATSASATTTSISTTPVASQPQNTPTPGTSNTALMTQRVDIGVATLYIRCLGQGSPTVVLNSGPGEGWASWRHVMLEVAKFTRVCAYDRAGLGQSSTGPKPRTSQQMTDELGALLEKADIPGPYVLVSHATSNWIDRMYTAQHRDQVVALVFVSPFHEDMISGTLAILAPYPTDLATNRREIASQGEGQSVEDWLTSADQVRAVGTLGDLPLILLARGKTYPSSEPYAAQIDAMLAEQEQQLLALSTSSVRLVAEHSGHFIQRDQPQAVVDAIRLAISLTQPTQMPSQ